LALSSFRNDFFESYTAFTVDLAQHVGSHL